jgi:hypothetical protein
MKTIDPITTTFDFNARATGGEADFFSEAELALVVWVVDPETGEERELVIPFSLITKLWPELVPTMDRLEGLIRAGELE